MKSKDEIMRMLFATIAELQSGSVERYSGLWEYLTTKLEVLNNILEDEIPVEYWEQISDLLD